ncbi:MAG: peptide chain release factor N(5)-glutamine methyltransferase [Bacteroidetes bacterium]|nr:peptide chain release factor N(5)-glutamine methyltransferase [Bacteroidota bacterium]
MSKIYLQKIKQELIECLDSEREANFVFRSLISEFSEVPFSQVILVEDKDLTKEAITSIEKAIERIKLNEPLQHILGKTEFCDLQIFCSKSALIPRPETEELVHWINEDFKNKRNLTFLDLCTGTGCIALSLKANFPESRVEGLDFSDHALELAELNSKNLNLEIINYKANILEDWSPKLMEYDVWVSNPPYIPESEKTSMDIKVVDFEPDMALFVPDDSPVIFYERIAEKGLAFLKNNGHLYVEIHEDYTDNVIAILSKFGYRNLEVRQDLQGKNRMIKAVK